MTASNFDNVLSVLLDRRPFQVIYAVVVKQDGYPSRCEKHCHTFANHHGARMIHFKAPASVQLYGEQIIAAPANTET